MQDSFKLRIGLVDNIVWILLAAFFAACALWVPAFASRVNLVNILYHTAIMSMLVLAQGFVLMSGHLDLSIDSVLAFAPGMAVLLATRWFPDLPGGPWATILLTLGIGALVGLFNGLCVARLGMNAFMLTLSVSIILRGLVLFFIPLSIFPLDPVYSFLGKARIEQLGGIPAAIPATFFIYFFFHVLIKHTVLGRNYLATGGNARAAYIAGIDTKRMVVLGFVAAGILSAVAGMLAAGRQDSVSNTMGSGMTLLAFAGALLGGTSMSGGKGSAFGMLGGALLLGMFANALNLLGVKVTLIHAAQGALILVAILLDRVRIFIRGAMLRREQAAKLEGGDGMKKRALPCTLAALLAALSISAAGVADADAGRPVVGMIIKEPTAPYIQAFIKGAEEEAARAGADLMIRDGEGDSIKIMEIIDTYMARGIDAFILGGAVDLRALVPGIRRLNEAGIPVAAIDTSPEGGVVDYFLSFDLAQSSAKAARLFVDGIRARNGGAVPEGVVLEIIGDSADMFCHSCTEGFMSVLSQYPQIEVAQGEGKWNNTDSNAIASDLLTRFGGRVLGIYVQTPDIMGPGVVAAIEAAGLKAKDFGICGICIGPEGLDLIRNGKMLGAVAQPAYDAAALAVRYLVDGLRGNPIPAIGDTIVADGQIWSPAEVVRNPWADDGAFVVLQGPLVPQEVSPDDPRLWENMQAE
jgi:ribose/xylose/arabinose/galactoside ABC-type transport system permease subunit/ABC-type sugar transport system substrate-binding protein